MDILLISISKILDSSIDHYVNANDSDLIDIQFILNVNGCVLVDLPFILNVNDYALLTFHLFSMLMIILSNILFILSVNDYALLTYLSFLYQFSYDITINYYT